MRSVETVLFLVVIATVVAAFARRLRIPAPSLLVVVGVVVGLLPGVPAVQVSPDVISLIVLPPLLFAAGEELPLRDLRAVWRPVTVLSVGLVLASAGAVAAVVAVITPLPWGMAFVLGAVLASTDPVAVTALGRRLALPPQVQALVQAESLFNDVTSLLLFKVALAVAVSAGALSWVDTVSQFALLAGGGLITGALVAAGAFLVRRRTEDPVLETVIALVTPYAAYVLAESVHASGVTAVVVASVILGTLSDRASSARIRLQLGAVYATVVFLLESVVFGLIGLQLPTLIRGLDEVGGQWLWQAAVLAVTLVVVRLLWVFPLSAIVQRRGGIRRPSWQVPAVVSWAGARGVVPLAAALSIPLATSAGVPLPLRDLVLLLTAAVIVLTLVVQGFTLAPLVRRAGIALTPDHVRHEHASARLALAKAALVHLDVLTETEAIQQVVVAQLRDRWQGRVDRIEEAVLDEPSTSPTSTSYRRVRRDLLLVEGAELNRLYEAGDITDATRRRIQRTLDLEFAGLGEDDQ